MSEKVDKPKNVKKKQHIDPCSTAKDRRINSSPVGTGACESDIPWRERTRVPLTIGSQVSGLSPAALYRAAHEGKLKLVNLSGRVLVDVKSLISFTESAEPWKPSTRGAAGRAAKNDSAARRWR